MWCKHLVFANLVLFKCLVAPHTDLWRKSLTYYSVCLKTHPKAATGKGKFLSRAEDHQSALGSHSLWSFKLNIQSYSLRVWYVILWCLVSDCELAWSSVRNFPATWVYIWPGCHFIEKKGYKNKLSGWGTYPTANVTYASGYIYFT